MAHTLTTYKYNELQVSFTIQNKLQSQLQITLLL
jgi:hypothetical protein